MTLSWRPLGPRDAWKDARAAAALDGRIVVAAADGRLHAVDAASGDARPVGAPDWQVRLLAAADGRVFAFDEAGPLYAVDPEGGWERLDGDWAEARAAVGADRLYVSGGGALLAVDPADGGAVRVGDTDWHT